jgi:ribosomal protein S18 acetylase RimI-like enzyme
MQIPIEIGVATPDDAVVLTELAVAFHLEDGHPLSDRARSEVSALTKSSALAVTYLVRQAWSTIGYGVLALGYSVEYGGAVGFVDDVYIVKAARGQGIGQRLLEHMLAEAGDRGLVAVHLEIEPNNQSAQALYRQLGFELSPRLTMNKALV